MTDIKVVSKIRHSAKRWKRYESYAFATKEVLVPIVAAEFAKACMAFPIAFTKTDTGITPVAVLGLVGGKNLFVAKTGRWIGGYIPAAFRGYPFRLGLTPKGERVLCVDEASGLLVTLNEDDTKKTEYFFDEEGNPSIAINKVLDFLSQVDESRKATKSICNLLEVHGLIEPWPIVLKAEQGDRHIEGLLRINETALNKLKSRAVTALYKENALMLAYCQILSMQTLSLLVQLTEAHARAADDSINLPKPAPSGEIDFSFLAD